jgi:P-type Cu+ transporter
VKNELKSDLITLNVRGMDCANCAMGITKKLTKQGHEQVHVDFATGEASLQMKEGSSVNEVIDSIQDLGYTVVLPETKAAFWNIERKFYFTLPFTIPLFFGHMFFGHDAWINHPLVQLLLCLPVAVIGFLHFGKSAWGSLKSGVPNMDVLIFMGSFSAMVYSVMGMIQHGFDHEAHHYMFFETAATIITLVFLGNLIEHRSVKRTTLAIEELSSLQVKDARRVVYTFQGEQTETVSSNELRVDDIVVVSNGESFPADGILMSDAITVNEAMLTGESLPAERTKGDEIIGGSIALNGPVKVKVTRVGKETTLSRIIELVKQAQRDKPQVQQLADRIAAIFVPTVVAFSVTTFLVAYFAFDVSLRNSLLQSIAVLVISCPCAMGLATPTAVMVGIGRAAKKGILIRGGNTLETLAKVKYAVFDKTGTLTTGAFTKIHIDAHNSSNEEELATVLLGTEMQSQHPIAQSIVRVLKKRNITPKPITRIEELAGLGLKVVDQAGNTWNIGSWRLVNEELRRDTADLYIIKNQQLAGYVELRDELRPGMKVMIEELRNQNVVPVLLSGDRKVKCERIAAELGITEIWSEQLPQDKIQRIDEYRARGTTIMIGDGINDAPALAKADIGISHGTASHVAMQSAQVLLVGTNEMEKLPEALKIGKHTLLTIKQNLFWAFFYNVVAIPIAAVGLLSPMIGALSMAFSDVIVIGNSIRLHTKKLN